MPSALHDDYRVLILAPFGKDAMLVREVLSARGFRWGWSILSTA